jgi:hypothetical protein
MNGAVIPTCIAQVDSFLEDQIKKEQKGNLMGLLDLQAQAIQLLTLGGKNKNGAPSQFLEVNFV